MPFFSRLEPMMTSLLNGLLGALEKDEREVVSGDLLEAHESPSASVFQVLGLILRRQIIHWADWRPWIVLTTVAIPLGVVLSQTAREFAGWSAVYSWMLVNNTDAALLRNAGFWNGALEYSWTIGKFGIVLFCCSWACGRLIAQLSRKARLSVGMLFLITSFFVNIIGIPSHARAFLVNTNDKYFPNGAVFALSFYRVWFPLIIYAITVLVPLFLGIIQTKTSVRRSKAFNLLSSCCTVLVIVGLIDQPWLLIELWSWQIIPASLVHLPYLLPFASIGPAFYLLIGLRKRWSTNGRAISVP
jgi:hypothetical protein